MPKCVIPAKVEKVQSMALVDTGSSDNFINKKFAHDNQLNFMSYNQTVNMASVSQFKKTSYCCYVDISFNDLYCKLIKLLIMSMLCTPGILGHPFLSQLKSVRFDFDGDREQITVGSMQNMHTAFPPLFSNLLANVRPIAIPLQRYSLANKILIHAEVKGLLQ
ncbi:hypothetical protein GJ496_004287 [Pomphorhynchus laevis]|nr:hypothetical protein GJ496_004287 [Pomphorhynchus laevis]